MVEPAGIKRRYRRGRRKNKKNSDMYIRNKVKLFHLNIRGFNSKRKSLESILGNVSPAIVTVNETALQFKQKPKLKNYISINRNRTDRIMGGVATFVAASDKDSFTKISEGAQYDEYLVTRHSNFSEPLNVINVYGEQECRSSKNELEERWGRILKEIYQIEMRGEMLILIGDLNKHTGNDELGINNNHSKISFGGELLRGFLSSGRYICLNNSRKASGGPFTRYDPSKPIIREHMSCLDYVIISKALEPFIESLEIDSTMKYSPKREPYQNLNL